MKSACACRRAAWAALLALVVQVLTLAPVRAAEEPRFPDVVGVRVSERSPEVFDFDVTVSSPYDTPARYADAFRVTTESGEVLGERRLLHDHRGEQPFTRDLHAVRIPRSIRTVVVQARDRRYGYGGKTVKVELPGR